jgi:hypothetical protein
MMSEQKPEPDDDDDDDDDDEKRAPGILADKDVATEDIEHKDCPA